MAAAAVPVAMMAGSAISSYLGRKTAKDIAKQGRELTPEERQAFQGGMGTAGSLGEMGQLLYGRGRQDLGAASNYYQTLLGRGGRSAMQAMVAPAAENISDVYGGAERGIESGYTRGGSRDLALEETRRQKAGQIARLTQGVQPQAAGMLGSLGLAQTGQGVGAQQGAGGLYSSLLGTMTGGRAIGLQGAIAGDRTGTAAGQNIGSLLFALMQSGQGKKGGGGIPVAPPGKWSPTAVSPGMGG